MQFECWSSGLELWSPVLLSPHHINTLKVCYVKQIKGQYYQIFLDPLGRWFRTKINVCG